MQFMVKIGSNSGGLELIVGGQLISDSLRGLSAGFVNVVENTAKGLQLGLQNFAGKSYGLQVGVFNGAAEIHGAQVGVANVQWGDYDTGSFKVYGAQVGIFNINDEDYGAQIGVTNVVGRMNGIQIGVYCEAKSGRFVQLGLLTKRADRPGPWYRQVTPILGMHFSDAPYSPPNAYSV